MPTNLKDKTVVQLRQLCKKKNIRLTKQDGGYRTKSSLLRSLHSKNNKKYIKGQKGGSGGYEWGQQNGSSIFIRVGTQITFNHTNNNNNNNNNTNPPIIITIQLINKSDGVSYILKKDNQERRVWRTLDQFTTYLNNLQENRGYTFSITSRRGGGEQGRRGARAEGSEGAR